jgi:hypothetical protein
MYEQGERPHPGPETARTRALQSLTLLRATLDSLEAVLQEGQVTNVIEPLGAARGHLDTLGDRCVELRLFDFIRRGVVEP